MMELPKEFDDRHWWILVAIAGGLIAVASAPVKFVPGFLVGLGLLVFGVGQWIDHPIRSSLSHGFKVTAYPWSPTFFGVVLSLVGVGLAGFGLWRLVFGAA